MGHTDIKSDDICCMDRRTYGWTEGHNIKKYGNYLHISRVHFDLQNNAKEISDLEQVASCSTLLIKSAILESTLILLLATAEMSWIFLLTSSKNITQA